MSQLEATMEGSFSARKQQNMWQPQSQEYVFMQLLLANMVGSIRCLMKSSSVPLLTHRCLYVVPEQLLALSC